MKDCLLCRPVDADRAFHRIRVWQDELWRLSVVVTGPILGFAHLEPIRHIPDVTGLDGAEATTFGPVLATVTRHLKQVTRAELVYCNIFGERVAHFHVNLAPHVPGDHLLGGPGMLGPGAADRAESDHRRTAQALQAVLRH